MPRFLDMYAQPNWRRRTDKNKPEHTKKNNLNAERLYLWTVRTLLLQRELWRTYRAGTLGNHINIHFLINFLGWDADDGEKCSGAKLISALEALEAELLAQQTDLPDTLDHNTRALAELLNLSPLGETVLKYAVLIRTQQVLRMAAGHVGEVNANNISHILAVVLGEDADAVRKLFTGNSPFNTTRALRVYKGSEHTLDDAFNIMDSLPEILLSPTDDLTSLFTPYYATAPQSKQNVDDFPHLAEITDLLHRFFHNILNKNIAQSSSESKTTPPLGVNILIYGRPGTGKTAFARALSHKLGADLFEVAVSDADDDPRNRYERLQAYAFAQAVLQNRREKTLLLFDEIEDIFSNEVGKNDDGDLYKGWLNQRLEQNQVPMIWISNSISRVDPAVLRRFDYVLKMPAPPRSLKQNLLEKCNEKLPHPLSQAWCKNASDQKNLTAADIDRAVRVVTFAEPKDSIETERFMARALSARPGGVPFHFLDQKRRAPNLEYDLNLLNPDQDIVRLAEGIRRTQWARLCLYGPPGTGKTAYGHYLAEALDKPLQLVSASDLLDPYVGQTEQNIARVFGEAREREAILLIDEADSFLYNRAQSTRSWEVTQVNELLTQLERFDGIVIMTTNRMEGLDKAVLRRLDLKVKFDYLRPNQRAQCAENALKNLGWLDNIPENISDNFAEKLNHAVHDLHECTPGDFMAACRHLTLTPLEIKSAQDGLNHLVHAVEAALRLKNDHGKKIGFL